MDDEVGEHRPPIESEVLDFGPQPTWSPRRRWQLSLAALAVVLVGGVGWFGYRTWQTNHPIFTRAEVLAVYHSPSPLPGDRLTWDADSVTTRDMEPDEEDSVPIDPSECGTVLMDDTGPTSDDLITVELQAIDGSFSGENYSRVAATFLYSTSDTAGTKVLTMQGMLARCTTFSAGDLTFAIHNVHSSKDRRGASALGYELTVANQPEPIRIELTQLGNAVTWTVGAEADSAAAPGSGSVNRQVVSSLRSLYRDR